METVIVRSKDPKELAGGKRFLEIQQEDCPAGVIADALQSDPEYVPALMARAARAERENQAAAVEDYEKVLEVFPKFAPAVQAIKRIQSKKAPES
jgi:Tfp pilus assembly protein PilF